MFYYLLIFLLLRNDNGVVPRRKKKTFVFIYIVLFLNMIFNNEQKCCHPNSFRKEEKRNWDGTVVWKILSKLFCKCNTNYSYFKQIIFHIIAYWHIEYNFILRCQYFKCWDLLNFKLSVRYILQCRIHGIIWNIIFNYMNDKINSNFKPSISCWYN